MHSEIYIHSKQDITPNRLLAGMPPSGNIANLYQQTYLGNIPDFLGDVIYAHSEPSCVYLLFQDDEFSLRTHVEVPGDPGNLRRLTRKSEEIAARFRDAARRANYKVDSLRINFFADEYLIGSGMHRGFWRGLWRRFVENIYADVAIGVFTFVFAGLLTGHWKEALAGGGAAVLCLLLWIIIQAAQGASGYDYERF